jgi:hypothetical protein
MSNEIRKYTKLIQFAVLIFILDNNEILILLIFQRGNKTEEKTDARVGREKSFLKFQTMGGIF